MKPWNIGNNEVLNIKMPFCLHWYQSATLSLISDFFFFFDDPLRSVCSIVVLIKFCFCSTQHYCFCYYYVPFFVLSPFDVFPLMNVLFILLCMFNFLFFCFCFFGRFCYVFILERLWFYALWFANVGFYCIWLIAVANNILHNFSIFRSLHQSWCLSLN